MDLKIFQNILEISKHSFNQPVLKQNLLLENMLQTENLQQTASTPAIADVKKEILEFCLSPQSKESILQFIQVDLKPYNYKKYITRLFEDRYLQHTIPHNPRATTQQYITSKKGMAYLKSIAI